MGAVRDAFREANETDEGYTHPSDEPEKRLDYVLAVDAVSDGTHTIPLTKLQIKSSATNPLMKAQLSDHLSMVYFHQAMYPIMLTFLMALHTSAMQILLQIR